MKRFLSLCLVAFLVVSCSPQPAPTTPSNDLQFTWPYIYTRTVKADSDESASAWIVDSNGPVTDAAVTISYLGHSQGLTFTSNGDMSVSVKGFIFVTMTGAQYSTDGLDYTPGQACTMSVSFGGKNYSASVTTVGNPVFTPGVASVTCAWDGGGNNNEIFAYNGAWVTFGPNLISPEVILDSSLPDYSPGTYGLIANLEDDGAFPSLSNGSYFDANSATSEVFIY